MQDCTAHGSTRVSVSMLARKPSLPAPSLLLRPSLLRLPSSLFPSALFGACCELWRTPMVTVVRKLHVGQRVDLRLGGGRIDAREACESVGTVDVHRAGSCRGCARVGASLRARRMHTASTIRISTSTAAVQTRLNASANPGRLSAMLSSTPTVTPQSVHTASSRDNALTHTRSCARTADALAAGAPEGEGGVHFVLDLFPRVGEYGGRRQEWHADALPARVATQGSGAEANGAEAI